MGIATQVLCQWILINTYIIKIYFEMIEICMNMKYVTL